MQSGEQELLDSVQMSSFEMQEQGNCGRSQLLSLNDREQTTRNFLFFAYKTDNTDPQVFIYVYYWRNPEFPYGEMM